MGVLSRQEAMELASQRELDLVEISPNADPPVAKIVDWGKYNYQRTKQLQKQKRGAKNPEMKQMRLGLKIGDHDLDVKLKKVTGFLETGHKVKITIFYRGREMAHRDMGFQLADRVIQMLGDTIAVDQQPQLAGKQLSFTIRNTGHSSPKASPQKAQADESPNQQASPSIKGIEKIEVRSTDAKTENA